MTNQNTDPEMLIIYKQMACNMNEINNGFLLSNLATNQPDKGRPTNELIGMVNNMLPNSASVISKEVLMVGIRAAQLEKTNPDIKKYALSAIRCLSLFSN